jgi:hypothetical protein
MMVTSFHFDYFDMCKKPRAATVVTPFTSSLHKSLLTTVVHDSFSFGGIVWPVEFLSDW